MDKAQMLSKIYEVIANKELSFGCKVSLPFRKNVRQILNKKTGDYEDVRQYDGIEHLEGVVTHYCKIREHEYESGWWYDVSEDITICFTTGWSMYREDSVDYIYRHSRMPERKGRYANTKRFELHPNFMGEDKICKYICQDHSDRDDFFEHILQIIGHPVLLGDVIHYLTIRYEHYFMQNTPGYVLDKCFSSLLTLWHSLRLPIDQQSDECITYVHDLVCNV